MISKEKYKKTLVRPEYIEVYKDMVLNPFTISYGA